MTLRQIKANIGDQLCIPSAVQSAALWVEDLLDPRDDHADDPADGPPATPESAALASTDDAPLTLTDVGTPLEEGSVFDGTPLAHPDVMRFDPVMTAHQLPPHLMHDMKARLNAALQPGLDYFRLLGLSERSSQPNENSWLGSLT